MLSLIIPTYCERDNMEPLITRLETVRTALGEPLEVLIVDSGSPDGTVEAATSRLSRHGLGRVVSLSARSGLAEAVMAGVRQAAGDLIGVMDADLSHPPELLPTLMKSVRSGYEVAVASRYVPGGGVIGWSWMRRLLSRLGNQLARPLARVSDATSGYFVCRADLVNTLRLRPEGFKILLDILVAGCVHDVEEIPYTFVNRVRGTSKLSRDILGLYLRQLARLYGYRLLHPCRHRPRPPSARIDEMGLASTPAVSSFTTRIDA